MMIMKTMMTIIKKYNYKNNNNTNNPNPNNKYI